MTAKQQTKTFSRAIALLYLLCGIGVILVASAVLVPTVLVDTLDTAPWPRVVNLRTNAYHLWQQERLSVLMAELLTQISNLLNLPAVTPACIQAIILFFGTILVSLALRPVRGTPHPAIGFLASIPVLLLVLTIGWDPVVLSIFAWVPLLAIAASALLLTQRAGKTLAAAPVWIIGTSLSVQNALSSNHMAPLSALASLLLAYALTAADPSTTSVEGESTSHSGGNTNSLLVPLIVLLPALVAAFLTSPHAPLPDYPPLAHVVPDDGLEGVMHPLIGRHYPLHVLDRPAVKAGLYMQSVIVSWLAFISWLLFRKKLRHRGFAAILAALILALSALLDTALPEPYSAIAPVASLGRLIPWGTIFCLASLSIAAAAWLLGAFLISNPASKTGGLLAALALTSLGLLEFDHYEDREREFAALSQEQLAPIAVSPSAATLRHHLRATGVSPSTLLTGLTELHTTTWQSIRKNASPSFETSTGAKAKVRKKAQTATVSLPVQFPKPRGSEFLSISCVNPITTKGIKLKLGKNRSDFPRGITIQSGTCSAPTKTLAEIPDWQGAIALTPHGYPYFRGQDDLRIVFAEEVTTSSLCIRQTSISSFDWYVDDVEIMTPHSSAASNDPALH